MCYEIFAVFVYFNGSDWRAIAMLSRRDEIAIALRKHSHDVPIEPLSVGEKAVLGIRRDECLAENETIARKGGYSFALV